MGVFDGQIQIPLAVPDPKTDWTLPPCGALSYSGVTSDRALAGTNGHDCLLLSGNRDRQMNGNESTRITQNRSHDVGGNQHKQVTGNKDENIVGNFNHQTTGNLHRTIIGSTNELYTGCHTLAHKDDQKLQEPTTYMHDVDNHWTIEGEKHDQFGAYQLYAGSVLNVIGSNIDAKLTQAALIVASAEKTVLSWAEHLAKIHEAAVDQRFEALNSKIGAIQPVMHVTMLHEVAFTQKILVIGANQIV